MLGYKKNDMKNFTIIAVYLFLSFNLYSQNKSFEVTYAVGTSNPKLTKNKKKIKILKDIEYQLKSNFNESTFKIIDKNSISFDNNISVGRIGSKDDIFYRNIKNKESIKYVSRFFDKGATLIKESFHKYNWKLTKETKKIGKYLCFKAIAEEKYLSVSNGKYYTNVIIAWYTPDIPISSGPSNYFGLPGLILEVSKKNIHFIVNNILINEQDIKIEKPYAEYQLTEKEAEDFTMKFIEKYRRKKKN